MKIFQIALLLIALRANSQSIELRAGYSNAASQFIGARYEHWTNGVFNLAACGMYEKSRSNRLNYTCVAADLRLEYSNNSQNENLFSWRTGVGFTGMQEQEPWLIAGTRYNYGIMGEGMIECYLSETFRLNLFLQQRYLTRPARSRSYLGIGLSYRINSY